MRVFLVRCIRPFAILGLAIAAWAPGSAAAANIVGNGDFGTGDFTGWTLTGDTNDASVNPMGAGFAAALTTSPTAPDFGALTQNLTTAVGQPYTVSFVVTGDGATPNSLTASLGGTTLNSLTNVGSATSTFTSSYTATATTTPLSFQFRDDPGFLFLTNISVTPVPEPSTLAVGGLAALILSARRPRRARRGTALRAVA